MAPPASANVGTPGKEQQMHDTPRRRIVAPQFSVLLAALASTICVSQAQNVPEGIPDNATARTYSDGWSCDRNYRRTDGSCTRVDVPANAFPTDTSYGRGWECAHGFMIAGQSCVAISVPSNAFLDSSGNRWKCARGYRMGGGECVEIRVPPHGYLDPSGDRWRCDRGYRADGERCVRVEIPDNAYFVEASYGRGWNCERGFRPSDDACIAISLPPNAHLDYSGNDWDCDRPYHRLRTDCVPNGGVSE
jgi:hypothetical protein